GQVVVDRLRNADHGKLVFGMQTGRHTESVLAADGDERVESLALEARQHPVDAAVELERVRPGRPEDRAAAGQKSRDLPGPERFEEALDEALPALAHAHDLASPDHHAAPDRPDDGVQTWTVAASGEDSNA